MDLFAAEIGMDPAEVRRRNLIPADAVPVHHADRAPPTTSGDYERGARPRARGGRLRRRCGPSRQRRRAAGDRSPARHRPRRSTSRSPPAPGGHRVRRRSRCARTAGSGSLHRHLAARAGPRHRVGDARQRRARHPDGRDRGRPRRHRPRARGRGTGGSRSLQLGGPPSRAAAGQAGRPGPAAGGRPARGQPRRRRARRPSRPLPRGRHAGRSRIGWAELVEAADATGFGPLFGEGDFTAPAARPSRSGAHVAVVEVDTETGKVAPASGCVAVDDAGRILNPLLADGQVHGGSPRARPRRCSRRSSTTRTATRSRRTSPTTPSISAAELPSFELVHMETPTLGTPLGAKGIGESGTIGSTPAVQNAVVDALAHLGVRHVDMPRRRSGSGGPWRPRALPVAVPRRGASERLGAPFSGADANDGVDRRDPDLPVTDLPGAGRLGDGVDDLVDLVVVDGDLDAALSGGSRPGTRRPGRSRCGRPGGRSPGRR